MESKNIILESSINFKTREEYEKYRKREEARAFVEECRRKQIERAVAEATVGSYHRFAGQAMPDSWRKTVFCRNKNNEQETKKDTTFDS